MNPETWNEIQRLFFEALEQPAESREAFLVEACAARDDLRAEVTAMLAAHGEGSALPLEASLLGPGNVSMEGSQVGPYLLERLLGQGGMGEVYLAARADSHYRQEVALKVVRPGLAAAEALARFRVERQILASLEHTNIAALLDGGVIEDGRPYLVMQYVEGLPITEYCDLHRLSVEARLALFRVVCRTVQFAHANLVVHRDLKPSNILVTAAKEVKLLDFGIAKLLDPQALDVSVALTQTQARVMTPEYAAPEQVRGEAITTATDVYALGALLYELLTGHRPYHLPSGNQAEVDRIICEEEPSRPSTVVSRTAQIKSQDATAAAVAPAKVSAVRSTRPERLRRRLRGDLDNIVLMALRKAPERRYASAEALSDDVRRYLEGHPVSARPDTAGYRLRKFVRRHRAGVAAAAALSLLTLGFTVTMAVQTSRIARQADELTAERDRAEREAEKTTQVKALVSDLFKVLDPNTTDGGSGEPLERLEMGSRRIVLDLAGQPELQAELMDELITIYINLGLYAAALSMAEDSLDVRRATVGPKHPAVAWGQQRLGEVLVLNGRFEAAEARYREALALQRALLGDDHVDVALSLMRLSRVLRTQGQLAQAEACAKEALSIYRAAYGEAHPDVAEALYWLADTYRGGGDAPRAEPLYVQALNLRRRLLGRDHPEVAWTLATLASIKIEQGQLDEAETMIREALAIHERRYGAEHPDTTRTRQVLGAVHEERGEWEEAEAIYRSTLAARRKMLGSDHPATAVPLESLGRMRQRQGDVEEAEVLFQEALTIRRARLGEGQPGTLRLLSHLATLYDLSDRADKAAEYRTLLERARERLQETEADRSPEGAAATFVGDERDAPLPPR